MSRKAVFGKMTTCISDGTQRCAILSMDLPAGELCYEYEGVSMCLEMALFVQIIPFHYDPTRDSLSGALVEWVSGDPNVRHQWHTLYNYLFMAAVARLRGIAVT